MPALCVSGTWILVPFVSVGESTAAARDGELEVDLLKLLCSDLGGGEGKFPMGAGAAVSPIASSLCR
jgi:hypothetical protein